MEDNKVSKAWKTVAIIFIILFVLETAMIIYGSAIVSKEDSAKTQCSMNICSGYEAFYFDPSPSTCDCYVDSEVKLEKYIP